MSGIAGIIHFNGAPAPREFIEQMTDAMAHRGPDGIKHWVRGSVALGQCMLRTTFESLEETQPLANEDESIALIMDGQIDNWMELRTELLTKGAELRTRDDAELVLRAYETWEQDCLAHIDGDFALAIWDERRQELFCARDRVGNKPFNYYFDGSTLVFASELHAILALPSVPKEPNEGMLAEVMSDEWMTRDETIWRGVRRLVAAHTMIVGKSGQHISRYWAPDTTKAFRYRRDHEYFEHYLDIFTDCVRRKSRSHLPIAYEVSGGLDSSAVFCVAHKLLRESRLPAQDVVAYTLAFYDEPESNEVAYAKAVGEYIGVNIHEVKPSRLPIEWYREQAHFYQNIPNFPNGAMSTALHQRASSSGHRVLVTGVGGDHFLSGSQCYYAEELLKGHLDCVIDCLKVDVEALGARRALARLIRQGFAPLLPKPIRAFPQSLFSRTLQKSRLHEAWLAQPLRELLRARTNKFASEAQTPVACLGQRYLLAVLNHAFDDWGRELMQRSAARHGLELRHPFFSKNFIEFAFATPERLRSRGTQTKRIHAESLVGILPEVVRLRTSKAAFMAPSVNQLKQLEATLRSEIPRRRPNWLEIDGVQRLWEVFATTPELGWPNWCLLCIFAVDTAMPHRFGVGDFT